MSYLNTVIHSPKNREQFEKRRYDKRRENVEETIERKYYSDQGLNYQSPELQNNHKRISSHHVSFFQSPKRTNNKRNTENDLTVDRRRQNYETYHSKQKRRVIQTNLQLQRNYHQKTNPEVIMNQRLKKQNMQMKMDLIQLGQKYAKMKIQHKKIKSLQSPMRQITMIQNYFYNNNDSRKSLLIRNKQLERRNQQLMHDNYILQQRGQILSKRLEQFQHLSESFENLMQNFKRMQTDIQRDEENWMLEKERWKQDIFRYQTTIRNLQFQLRDKNKKYKRQY